MVELDVLIVGGGIAGLWTLDELVRRGFACALVERTALGDGQTMWSQGIIHSGLKYTLGGSMTGSAAAIREAPEIWKACLRGEAEPDLSAARVRSDHCWLWRTEKLASRLGMIGARVGLRVAPEEVTADETPPLLRGLRGVSRVAEPVVDVASVLEVFRARHVDRLIRGEAELSRDGARVGGLEIRADATVLCAGNGNAVLMEAVGLDPGERMQVRDLHMVMARGGRLPELHGHCVDFGKTRITVTSVRDAEDRVVWQIGGEVAEKGVGMTEADLISFARGEIEASIPGIDLTGVEWATYHAPRAEGRTAGGKRPEGPVVRREGDVIVAWPTKLSLAPMVAAEIAQAIDTTPRPRGRGRSDLTGPSVAPGPWAHAAWAGDA